MALTKVSTDGVKDDAVTLAKQAAGTDGQIITYDASGNPVAVGPGTDGQVLTSTGAGSPPAFESISIPAGTTINNNANDRVITGSGSANTLEGESNLTFGSDVLQVSSTTQGLGAKFINTGNEYTNLQFSANRTSAGNALGIMNAKWNNNHEVAAIYLQAGDDTTNKDDGQIKFYTSAASGSIAERLHIKNNGDVSVTDGNLVVGTSGHGIDFAATGDGSSSMSSELLDDYEEGGWTPAVGNGTVGVAAAGEYVKVGRMVYLSVLLYNFSDTSAATSILITGVPYAAVGQHVGQVWLRRTTTGNKNYCCTIGDSAATTINIKHDSDGNNMGGDLQHGDFAHATPYMNLSLTYQTAT